MKVTCFSSFTFAYLNRARVLYSTLRKFHPDWNLVALITDEPPPEVAAAGHDRCIVPIRPAYIDEWLSPGATDAKRLFEILDDRERPYYEHRMAA